jgi:putative hydrolase of the HAD superfamily
MHSVARELRSRLELSEPNWLPAFEESRLRVKARLGQVAASHSRLAYFKGMLEILGMPNQLDLALQLETIYWGEFMRRIVKADKLDDFLEVAREKAIPVVVVTDLTTGIQIRKLHRLGLIDLISGLVTSEDIGSDKPSLAIEEYVSSQLGFRADHWWVVGDDQVKDKGFAASLPSCDFHHVSADGSSSMNFAKLSKLLGEVQT